MASWEAFGDPISIVATSKYCIHLKLNPNSQDFWFFSIIYASLNVGNRQEVWQELRDFKAANIGPWCLAGDFNSITSSIERDGGAAINQRACSEFVNCIEECGLIDMGFSGAPFTWSRGTLKQRLDRVLCNLDWQNMFPNSNVTHVPLESSDHSGLWLKVEDGIARSKRNYFKFLGAWLDHTDFDNQVKYSWCISSDWKDNINRLTDNLKYWNKEVFGNIFKRKHRILKRLESIKNVLMNGPNDRLQKLRSELWEEYSMIIAHEEGYWYQQAKSKWVTLGDYNTRFFHQSTLVRRRKNRIMAMLANNDQWMYDDLSIQNYIINYFTTLYSSNLQSNGLFDCITSFPIIKNEDRILLEKEVSIEETKKALFSMNSYKPPGPDGFHPIFFKK